MNVQTARTTIARRGRLPRAPQVQRSTLAASPRYFSSSSSTFDDHHHAPSAEENYGPEGFFNPFWRNTLMAGLLAYGLYQFVPSESESNPITRFISKNIVHADVWAQANERHTILSEKTAEGRLISQAAQRPSIHRHRFPSSFESFSPHLVPVGDDVDVSGVVAKSR